VHGASAFPLADLYRSVLVYGPLSSITMRYPSPRGGFAKIPGKIPISLGLFEKTMKNYAIIAINKQFGYKKFLMWHDQALTRMGTEG